MTTNKKSLLILCLLFIASFSNAQNITSALIGKGDKAYARLQYSSAVDSYKQAYSNNKVSSTDEKRASVAAKIADCYWLMRAQDSAAVWYAKVPSNVADPNGIIQFRKAELNAAREDYSSASAGLTGLSGFEQKAAGYQKTSRMKADSADWNVKYLDAINTNYFREFSPLSLDGGLIWTTNQPKKFSRNGIMGWDRKGYNRLLSTTDTSKLSPIAVSAGRDLADDGSKDPKKPKRLAVHYSLADVEQLSIVKIPASLLGKVKSIEAMSAPLQYSGRYAYNLAHPSFDKSGDKFYFSANIQGRIKKGVRTVGIVESKKVGETLSESKYIFTGKTEFSVMHPAISPDGKTLVFSSNQPGGKGGFDLYYASSTSENTWSTPIPIELLNTVGNELFASFGPDGSLYFSSDAYAGLGGLDIYKATFKNGSASKPVHLSYPVNSSFDDFAMAMTADGKTGYFTSDRLGSDDIYKVNYEMKFVTISGDVISSESGKGKPGVKVILYEKDENGNWIKVDESATDADGHYSFKGRPNREYKVEIIDPMDSQTVEFNTNNTFNKKMVPTVTLRDKKPVVLPPPVPDTFRYIIYFDFDRSKITKESEAILDQVIAKLTENVEYKCSLAGHTDQEGTAKYNLKLSSKRAENAKKYIREYAGYAERVNTSFYGYTQPVIVTKNRKEAKKNRRVEITIAK